MKKFSFISVLAVAATLSFAFNQYNYSLKGNIWKIDKYLCLNEEVEHYILELHIKEQGKPNFGTFVEFLNDGTFRSYNHERCGNSIFRTISGTYFLKNQILTINVDTIVIRDNVKGVGGNITTEHRNKSYQFEVKQDKNKVDLFLIK